MKPLTKRDLKVRRNRRMAAAVEVGQTMVRVAADHGVSPETVRVVCRKAGVQAIRKSSSGRTLQILAAIVNNEKCSLAELSEILGGVPRARIHQVQVEARELGLV